VGSHGRGPLGVQRDPMGGDPWEREPLGAQGIPWERVLDPPWEGIPWEPKGSLGILRLRTSAWDSFAWKLSLGILRVGIVV